MKVNVKKYDAGEALDDGSDFGIEPLTALVRAGNNKIGLGGEPMTMAHDAMLAHALRAASMKLDATTRAVFEADAVAALGDIFQGKYDKFTTFDELKKSLGVTAEQLGIKNEEETLF